MASINSNLENSSGINWWGKSQEKYIHVSTYQSFILHDTLLVHEFFFKLQKNKFYINDKTNHMQDNRTLPPTIQCTGMFSHAQAFLPRFHTWGLNINLFPISTLFPLGFRHGSYILSHLPLYNVGKSGWQYISPYNNRQQKIVSEKKWLTITWRDVWTDDLREDSSLSFSRVVCSSCCFIFASCLRVQKPCLTKYSCSGFKKHYIRYV